MTKEEIKKEVEGMRSNMIETEDGVLYVFYDKETNELCAGSATNCGCSKDYTVEYDEFRSLDWNLEGLMDEIPNVKY